MDNYIFTCGDINGIGTEISIKALNNIFSKEKYKLTLIIPKNVFEYYSKIIPIKFPFEITDSFAKTNVDSGVVTILDIGNAELNIGKSTVQSGLASYKAILKAYDLVSENLGTAMITTPVSKTAWKLAGIKYTGHTDLLGDLTNVHNYLMMFLSSKFITALTTIHEPIEKVSSLITVDRIKNVVEQVQATSKFDLKIKSPRIAVLGLNPHAGEEGHLGMEEIDEIIPAVKELKEEGFNVEGPFVPDAFFGNKLQNKFDVTIGMYHDQVLIPFKLISFDEGVNYTAGLPIVRTSPDHGTAFDISRKLIANPNSLIESFYWARQIVKNRKCSLS